MMLAFGLLGAGGVADEGTPFPCPVIGVAAPGSGIQATAG